MIRDKKKVFKVILTCSCRRSGVNFTNILLAQKLPVDLRRTYLLNAQGVQCRSTVYFLVVCNGKVGCNFAGETEKHRRMTTCTLALCARRLVKLSPDDFNLFYGCTWVCK